MRTPIGNLTLTASESALISIEFKGTEHRDTSGVLIQAMDELQRYFEGSLTGFNTPLDIQGSHFQRRCWDELLKIPYGNTISYKAEAIKLGGANYARAVAGANNKNKLPIMIPCHRVIGNDGSLVGYAGGLDIKRKLLDIEKKGS